jgi:hypothetical protein
MLALFAAALAGIAAHADDAPPPIRQFDVATIEKLGRAMYEQDQEAWKGTDILTAKFNLDDLKAAGLRGWIVDTFPDRDVVRFVRQTGTGVELFHDVTFPKDGSPALSEPSSRTLSAEEQAQYDARSLAIKSTKTDCSDTYNTVVLKDPERAGWLVWVMTATKDPDKLIIGRHTRFSISADGKTIVGKDNLTVACFAFSRKDQKPDGAWGIHHIVSLTPVETHVFASLSYHIPLYIQTDDGEVWKVDQGSISVDKDDAPGLDGATARGLAGQEEKCKVIFSVTSDGKEKFVIGKDEIQVILPTENGAFSIKRAAEGRPVSVVCGRESLVPAPNDYKVLLAGYTLMIDDTGTGHPKSLGELEVVGGQLRFRMIDGAMSDAMKARIGARVDELQVAFNKKP